MKYFFHLLLILLTAFILAWVYEVYVVRDGNSAREDIFETTIQKWWGWEKILSGESSLTIAGFIDQLKGKTWEDKDAQDKVKPANWKSDPWNSDTWSTDPWNTDPWNTDTWNSDEKWVDKSPNELMKEYRTGVLWDEGFQSDPNSSTRYTVIEFCTPWVQLCKDSYEANMQEYFEEQIDSVNYDRQPYLTNFGWVDEKIWSWVLCVDEKDTSAYLNAVYESKKISNDTLPLISKRLKLQDVDACIAASNPRLYLRNAMKLSKEAFGISSLPTYVVLDAEEGKWVAIPGLYEKDQITPVLAKEFPLLKK